LVLAVDILKWPGVNQAFLVSFFVTLVLILAVIPFGKRRAPGKPLSWGEALVAATYTFAVLFLAFGVVPHQWISHADADLNWATDKYVYGPFDLLKAQAQGGNFPFTISYQAVRDLIVVVLHVFYFALMLGLWAWWQKRGKVTSTEIETSTYGRPLVKKA
jgi:hypothetical protein